jgi:hypothetical protein
MTTLARCPICDALLHCPCPSCRAAEPAGRGFPAVLHYGFIAGRVDGISRRPKPDVLCCPQCGFRGDIFAWELREVEQR